MRETAGGIFPKEEIRGRKKKMMTTECVKILLTRILIPQNDLFNVTLPDNNI